jgi:hypothetical protein
MMGWTFKLFSRCSDVDQWRASNLSLSVESTPQVRNSFMHACPDWKEGTYELFKDWDAKQLTDLQSEDEAEEGEVPVEFKKAKDNSFTRNEGGGLILFPMTDYKKIRQKQRLVHAYAGAMYSKSMHPTSCSQIF